MLKIEEYKGITIEQILNFTGLENPFADQSKYSLARQKELLLKLARKNNLLHLVPKTNPIDNVVINISIEKDLVITKLRKEEKIEYTNKLDLTKIPTEMVKEMGKTTIKINRKDIPSNLVTLPNTTYAYKVIGHFETKEAYYKGTQYETINGETEKVSTTYIIYTLKHTQGISLVILE